MPLVVVDEAVDGGWLDGVESSFRLGAQRRLVCLDCEQVIGARVLDRPRNFTVGGDGVDGDERAFQSAVGAKPLQQDRNRLELVALALDRLLPKHEAAGGGESGDQMQRRLAFGAIMTASRGFAIDGDKVGAVRPGFPHPGGESRRK